LAETGGASGGAFDGLRDTEGRATEDFAMVRAGVGLAVMRAVEDSADDEATGDGEELADT
jgi:hypothetical protein